jgi:hypothetical protein
LPANSSANSLRRSVKEKRLFPPLNVACELRDNRTRRAFQSQTACYATISG